MSQNSYVIPFDQLGIQDIPRVGGKNASLGEMICHLTKSGVKVPNGFATTAYAYQEFLTHNGLAEKIFPLLLELDVDDLAALKKTGKQIREWIIHAPFQSEFIDSVHDAYELLSHDSPLCAVAVRSSATAEDLPEASFAGQQESFLNIRGLDNILSSMKEVYASLFNDRAIAYRVHQGFDHQKVALSVGIQKMVRSDLASSGVMFTIDTESGFSDVVFITASFGLGELVVQGDVNPDEFYVYKKGLQAGKPAILSRHLGKKQAKLVYQEESVTAGNHAAVIKVMLPEEESRRFSISDNEIESLARQAMLIEQHYNQSMDIEWAKDGEDQQLYIVQARPETVKSSKKSNTLERYQLKSHGKILLTGRSVGQRIGVGKVKMIHDISEMDKIHPGDVLVTEMTDPDWEPIMKRVSGIVTSRGGRTCHAAIIARELGIPAIVGCQHATRDLKEGQSITVSCAQGETGYVYEGEAEFDIQKIELDNMPKLPFNIMMNVANPERAFNLRTLPNAGVGLARMEFIISQMIGIHPKACLNFEELSSEVKTKINERISGYASPTEFYVKKLSEGISTLAGAFSPHRVIVRFSDFKSNEYANLVGGSSFEPKEENPMLGFRGASRYISEDFQPCFALECEAIRFVRETMGLMNVEIMIPFVRTLNEAKKVIRILSEQGLERGKNDLKIQMMCELPSNAILADEFLEYFDGFSIGSNDLTQLTLGIDRDSGILEDSFNESDKAVKYLMKKAILACQKQGKYIGVCGQGPSDHPELAKWLAKKGINSISLNPDSVLKTWLFLAASLL